ncbi:hypothetical protein KHA80_03135 [Anaerobacillus sp. HL2]|nr:hypothetical protein KHA80_03135 [Anaerobacillus sp. HL2]
MISKELPPFCRTFLTSVEYWNLEEVIALCQIKNKRHHLLPKKQVKFLMMIATAKPPKSVAGSALSQTKKK